MQMEIVIVYVFKNRKIQIFKVWGMQRYAVQRETESYVP